jgi:hypothetical protein
MDMDMNKEINKIIEEKTNNILKKNKTTIDADFTLGRKINYSERIKKILKKTLVTPERRRRLAKKYNLPFKEIIKSNSNIFFCPNFEEMIKYIPPDIVINKMEKMPSEEIDNLCNLEFSFALYTCGISPYFTIQELSKVLQDFIIFLEINESSLIETGWPKCYFTPSAWLFYRIAPNYPIEIPSHIINFHKLKNPSDDQYFFYKHPDYIYYEKANNYKHKMVSITKNFSFSELGFLEEFRPKILDIKKRILKEINRNLFAGIVDKDLCFKNCMELLFGSLSRNDLARIEKIEKNFNQYQIYNSRIDGGLLSLLYIVVLIYNETKFGAVTLEKNTYDFLLKGSKFSNQESIKSFYQFVQFWVDEDENVRFNEIFYGLAEKLNKIYEKIELNDKFVLNILNSYESDYPYLELLVKPKYFANMKNVLGLLEDEKLNLNVSSLNLQCKTPKTPKKRIIPLDLPPGTKWGQIVIQFIDDERICIKAPNNFETISTFNDMCLINWKERYRGPNKIWKFFHFLAIHKGILARQELLRKYSKTSDEYNFIMYAKEYKYSLAKNLKAYFKLHQDPFTHDYKNDTYETSFRLLPQDHLLDQ